MVILKSQQFNDQELLDYARSLSSVSGSVEQQLLHWSFGPIMTMKHDLSSQNYLFSNENVPFHWDGAFFKEPRWLLFYCTESEGSGGETLFVNTEKIWNSLTDEEKNSSQHIELEYETEKVAHYGGKIRVPLVQAHPATGATILRMAERVISELNPVSLKIHGSQQPEKFYESFVQKLYDPEFVYEHRWEQGDLLVVDNFTYLHGRRHLGTNEKRSFKRIQIL
mgnify:CR=1 FL=1